MRQTLRRSGLIVFAAVVLFVSLSWVYAHQLTRARPSVVGAPPSDFPYRIESVTFTTRDEQRLSGWLVPAESRDRALVLLHGFGGTRMQMLPRARWLREQGYTSLLYDARACGESSGNAVTFGYRERADVIAAVTFLKERGYRDIACLGVSQGGATILFAAEELPDVKCVICESVYDEMRHAVDRRMRRYTFMPGWLGACAMVPLAEARVNVSIDAVRPVAHVGKLRCPLFVISGELDSRTWPEDTHRLFAAAREPKELWMIEDAEHQDLFHFPHYREKVGGFLRRHLELGFTQPIQ
jgi:dipeptidyl aminopeptidase/acylaminoacyl peptidase